MTTDLRQWAAAMMPSHAERLTLGARVRIVKLRAPGYPAAWEGLVGTVTAVLGEVPTYRVALDGVEIHPPRGGCAFLRQELEALS